MIPNATTSSISSANVRAYALLSRNDAAAADAFGVVDVCHIFIVSTPTLISSPVCTSSVNARAKLDDSDNDDDDDDDRTVS